MLLVLCLILAALVFEFINGFHDTANAIATSVATKVMTPRQAILLSAVFNLVGALIGTAVATTVGRGLVDIDMVNSRTLLCALAAAIAWNLATWWASLPSSSSHALIGGLCGAVLASAHGDWSVIRWSVVNAATGKAEGLWPKVVAPMILAPVIGIVLGFVLMSVLLTVFHNWRPSIVNRAFRISQLFSASWMSCSHGMNDAQKTMGLLALILYTATTKSNAFDHLPGWLGFLRCPQFEIPFWIKALCAVVLAAGTAAGGWRIIRTLGHRMVKLQPIHGFAAQTTAAAIIQLASIAGIPLSTTHVISASIMGVGATKRLNAVRWTVVERMVWAWILTLPVTAALSGFLIWALAPGR